MAKDRDRSPSTGNPDGGDPPPVIKQLIWLFDRENWRKHWPSILTGLILTGVLWFAAYHHDTSKTTPPTTRAEPADRPGGEVKDYIHAEETSPDTVHYDLLLEDERRAIITRALHDADCRTTILVLATLSGTAREEECTRAFESFLKKSMFSEAETVVEQCWTGGKRDSMLSRLEHERLKMRAKE